MHAYTQKHMRAHAYPSGSEKSPQFVQISSELEKWEFSMLSVMHNKSSVPSAKPYNQRPRSNKNNSAVHAVFLLWEAVVWGEGSRVCTCKRPGETYWTFNLFNANLKVYCCLSLVSYRLWRVQSVKWVPCLSPLASTSFHICCISLNGKKNAVKIFTSHPALCAKYTFQVVLTLIGLWEMVMVPLSVQLSRIRCLIFISRVRPVTD